MVSARLLPISFSATNSSKSVKAPSGKENWSGEFLSSSVFFGIEPPFF
jgi:hypothetical protein